MKNWKRRKNFFQRNPISTIRSQHFTTCRKRFYDLFQRILIKNLRLKTKIPENIENACSFLILSSDTHKTNSDIQSQVWNNTINCEENQKGAGEFWYNLTNDGGIGGKDPSVAIRDELEVGDGDNSVIKNLVKIIDDEIGAEGAKALIVQLQANFPRTRRRWSCRGQGRICT